MMNYQVVQLIIIPAIITAITAFVLSPLVIKLAWYLNLVDDPNTNKHPKVIHKKPTPRGGGLALFLAIVFASLLFLPLDRHLTGILLGATILVVMGILDDKYNLNPYLRIIIQFIAALFPVLSGIGISFLFNGGLDLSQPQFTINLLGQQFQFLPLADLFAVCWIVAIINFTNMGAKGIPGQLPGVGAIAALTIALLSLRFSADITEWPVTILASITAGALVGFLPFNTFPQRIMPAFSGSNLTGFLLAVLAILSTAKVGTLVVVMAVPLIDTGYTIVRRVLSGKSPVWGDRGHLHHKLLDLGWSQIQVTIFYWGITALLGILALNLNASSKLYTIVGVALVLGGTLLWLTSQTKTKS